MTRQASPGEHSDGSKLIEQKADKVQNMVEKEYYR